MLQVQRKPEDFADIINLPRPEPRCHPRMAMEKRAAQFAPFAALNGFADLIEQTNKKHEESITY